MTLPNGITVKQWSIQRKSLPTIHFDLKAKPHDSSIITKNLNQTEQVENSLQEIEDKVKSDKQSAILENGKIIAGRRKSYKFDEDVISELR